MCLPERMKFGNFLIPFHELGDSPTPVPERDIEPLQSCQGRNNLERRGQSGPG